MSDLYQHEKSDKVKWVLTLVAFIIVAVMLAGIICGWFERKEETKEQPAEVVAGCGMVVGKRKAEEFRSCRQRLCRRSMKLTA